MANFVSVVISGNSKPLRTALDKATANMSSFQKKVALGFIAAGAAATAAGQSVGGSALYRQFVQQCLAERGYHVIGWH